MKTVLWTPFAEAEISARLRALPEMDLTVVKDEAGFRTTVPSAETMIFGEFFYTPEIAQFIRAEAKQLKFIQLLSAGYDNLKRLGVAPGIIVANAGDAYSRSCATQALTMLLVVQRKFVTYVDNMRKHVWDRSLASSMLVPDGQTVVIVGMGGIGRAFARLLAPFNCHIIGVTRSGKPNDLAHEMVTSDQLHSVLPRADIVMIAAPLAPETRHMFSTREFALCKPNMTILNVGRGPIIDQKALVEALKSGKIGGAGLDVTDPEPLPPDDPLWDAPNIFIAPHTAGQAGTLGFQWLGQTAADNVERYMKDQPVEFRVTI